MGRRTSDLEAGGKDADTEELEIHDSELKKLLDELAKLVSAAEKSGDGMLSQKASKLKSASTKRDRAFRVVKDMKLEVKELRGALKSEWNKITRDHEFQLKQLDGEINRLQDDSNRDELLAGGSDKGQLKPGVGVNDVFNAINKVQDESDESLARSTQTTGRIKEMGTTINETLASQTEQLGRIHEGVRQVDSNAGRATKLLKTIGRRMMTDKLITLFVLIIVILIVIVVFYELIMQSTGMAKSGTGDSWI